MLELLIAETDRRGGAMEPILVELGLSPQHVRNLANRVDGGTVVYS